MFMLHFLQMVIILCHKPRWLQHRYRFREAAKIKDYFLEPVPPAPTVRMDEPEVYSVRLFKRSDQRRTPIALLTKTAAERDAWFHAILTAMDNVSPSTNVNGHVLRMNTFRPAGPKGLECDPNEPPPISVNPADAEQCFQCAKPLMGTFFQGYRCLRCQVSLHKACIGGKSPRDSFPMLTDQSLKSVPASKWAA